MGLLTLGKKTIKKGGSLGKKVGNAGLSLGKKVVKTAVGVAGVAGTALAVHSALTDQSIGDSAVDTLEFGKDVIESGRDVVETQQSKASIERELASDKSRLDKAKATKNILKETAQKKAERNKKRQESRLEKPTDRKERLRAEADAKAKEEKKKRDAVERARIGEVMRKAEDDMKKRNLRAKREECYSKTKSGKKGRLNLSVKDKSKCDKKHK